MFERAFTGLAAILAGSFAGLMSATATGKPPALETTGPLTKIEPARIATIKKTNGHVSMVGEWVPYSGFSSRQIPSGCLFDCFGRDWGPGATGTPANNGVCVGDGGRYWFGTTYNLPYSSDDLKVHRNGMIRQFDCGFAWLHPENPFYILVFLGNGDPDQCTALTSAKGFILEYRIIDFPFIFFSNVDLSRLTTPVSLTGVTSYELIMADSFDSGTGEFKLAVGPAQPLLWGTPRNLAREAPGAIMPGSFGDQGPGALDDDSPTDGVFEAGECHSYDFGPGVCADWLGKMVAFGGCPVDFNGDGFVTGDDFDGFVGAFVAGEISADYDGNGFVTGDDFDAFVIDFEVGC